MLAAAIAQEKDTMRGTRSTGRESSAIPPESSRDAATKPAKHTPATITIPTDEARRDPEAQSSEATKDATAHDATTIHVDGS